VISNVTWPAFRRGAPDFDYRASSSVISRIAAGRIALRLASLAQGKPFACFTNQIPISLVVSAGATRFVTVALTRSYDCRLTPATLLYAVWTFLGVPYGTPYHPAS